MPEAPVFRSKTGFSLLEMTLVLLIMALGLGMFMAQQVASVNNQKETITDERLEAIQEALRLFRSVHMRLPCPANGAYAPSSQYYGREAAGEGSCTGGTPAANQLGTNLAAGVVPTKTLGISDDFAMDGWGRKLTYAVDTRATAACAFTTYPISDTTVGFTVNDKDGNARSTRAWYAAISHGINGHGAYAMTGARISASSSNANEHLNCMCNAAVADQSLTGVYVQDFLSVNAADTNDRFDDTLSYAQREQIRSPAEERGIAETCP